MPNDVEIIKNSIETVKEFIVLVIYIISIIKQLKNSKEKNLKDMPFIARGCLRGE